MKSAFSLIVYLVLSSSTVMAQQCATFEFKQTESDVTSLFTVNHREPSIRYSARDLLTKKADYQIATGDHLLSAISVSRALLKQQNVLKVNGAKIKKANHVYMEAFYSFEANNHYVFGQNESTQELVLESKIEKACHRKTGRPLFEAPSTTITMSKLPSDLEQMLKELRMKMYRFYQSNNQQLPLSNIDVLKADEYFGTVTANTFTNKNAIQLLSVLPKSFAYEFGLRSGDVITKLGNSELDIDKKTPVEVLDAYLKNSKKLTITVIRQGEKLVFKGKYKVNVVPASIYAFGGTEALYNSSFNRQLAFPENLQFLYERTVKALAEYYQDRAISTERIQIYRPAEKIVSLGLEGVLIKGEGIKVELLANDSPLKSLGMAPGDVITTLDGLSLKDSIGNLVKAVNNLIEGDVINVTINRSGKSHRLQGKFQQPQLPTFSLLVNLKSEELALAMLEKAKSRFPRFYRGGNVGGTDWKPNSTPPQTPGELNRNNSK